MKMLWLNFNRTEKRTDETISSCLKWKVLSLEFREEALRLLLEKLHEKKTGARGLRSILENVLLDTMYDLPSLSMCHKVIIDEACNQ